MSRSELYDYVIAGAGTAGLVIAARLSENPDVSVCVLEAGGDLSLDEVIKEPAFFLHTLGRPDTDWAFFSVPQKGANERPLFLSRGKGLGGSSNLNFMLLGRGAAREYDAIEALGSEGWNWESLLQYFRKSETFTEDSVVAKELGVKVNENAHGNNGPLKSTLPYWNPELLVTYHETVQSMGVPANPDSSDGDNVGAWTGTLAVDTKTGYRCSSASEYYEPNKGRENLHTITNARVTRVIFRPRSGSEELEAEGFEYVQDGETRTILAKKEVIICAGTYQTPQLLELSGIGDENVLQPLGIPVLYNLPGVGNNLQDHISTTFTAEIDPKYLTINPFGKPETVAEKTAMLNGLTSTFAFMPVKHFVDDIDSLSEAVKNHSTDGAATGAAKTVKLQKKWFLDNRIPHMEVAQCSFFNPIMGTLPVPGASYLTYFIALLHPFSRGSVHVSSADPLGNPLIDPCFLDNPIDLALLVNVLKWTRKLVRTEKLASIVRDEITPGPGVQSDAELEEYVRNTAGTVYHCVGTASMLPEKDGGVVDAKMRVYGTKNLRVVDASIIPVQVSAHTQATVYAVAEKAADILKSL